MAAPPTAASLEAALIARLPATAASVQDVSGGCGAAFALARVVSPAFEGAPPLKRHRLVRRGQGGEWSGGRREGGRAIGGRRRPTSLVLRPTSLFLPAPPSQINAALKGELATIHALQIGKCMTPAEAEAAGSG
jgi:stress-induced morphogen